MDDFTADCYYLVLQYKKKPPINNSLTMALAKPLKEEQITEITSQAVKLFRLPCTYKWYEQKIQGYFRLILIFMPYSKPDSGEYNFDELYRAHRVELKHRIVEYLSSDNLLKEIVDSVSFKNKLPDTHEIFYGYDDEFDDELWDLERDEDDEDARSYFSNNVSSTNEADRDRSISSISSDSSASSSVGRWILKEDYRQTPAQLYSDYCVYGFTCINGKNCRYNHTNEEKKVFSYFDGKGVKSYKSEQCLNVNCQYRKEPLKCRFAHDLSEARCYKCVPKKGACKNHWMKDCQNMNFISVISRKYAQVI